MIINNVSQRIRSIVKEGFYESVNIPIRENEIAIGRMNDEEKAIFTFFCKSEDRDVKWFLIKKLNNSFRRFGGGNYFCRADFTVATRLDISRLIWRPYTPSPN